MSSCDGSMMMCLTESSGSARTLLERPARNKNMKINSLVPLAGVIWFLSSGFGQQSSPLSLFHTITLPNVQGGFNHMSVDPVQQRLFAAAPTNGTIEIVDLKAGKALRSLEGKRPAAARFSREFNQLYASRGQSVYIYDGKTLDQIAKINLQSSLDEIQYDARAKQLYVGVMAPEKTALAILSITDGKLLGQIKLPGKPQGFIVEQKGKRIFANIPALKQIAVMDRESRTLLPPWPLAGTQGNYPIDLDEDRHRLFVGCREPARMVVFDTASGKPVANIQINGDTDDLFYDAARKRVYVSSGDGSIDVIDQLDADHYRARARIATVSGARTSTLSAALNMFCLGVPRRGSEPAELRVFQGQK
jgi:DNA-binding beta-propeller fold protein YncE